MGTLTICTWRCAVNQAKISRNAIYLVPSLQANFFQSFFREKGGYPIPGHRISHYNPIQRGLKSSVLGLTKRKAARVIPKVGKQMGAGTWSRFKVTGETPFEKRGQERAHLPWWTMTARIDVRFFRYRRKAVVVPSRVGGKTEEKLVRQAVRRGWWRDGAQENERGEWKARTESLPPLSHSAVELAPANPLGKLSVGQALLIPDGVTCPLAPLC